MGKHFFVIQHRNRNFKCYFDEERRIHVMEEGGNEIAVSDPIDVERIDLAKDKARELLQSLEKKLR